MKLYSEGCAQGNAGGVGELGGVGLSFKSRLIILIEAKLCLKQGNNSPDDLMLIVYKLQNISCKREEQQVTKTSIIQISLIFNHTVFWSEQSFNV